MSSNLARSAALLSSGVALWLVSDVDRAELSVGRVDPWVGSGQTFAVSIFVMLRYFEGME